MQVIEMFRLLGLVVFVTGLSAMQSTRAEAAPSFEDRPTIGSKVERVQPLRTEPLNSPSSRRLTTSQGLTSDAPAPSRPAITAAPELDPAGASAVALILLGAAAMLTDRRRRA